MVCRIFVVRYDGTAAKEMEIALAPFALLKGSPSEVFGKL